MAIGLSLHIGLNFVNPAAYNGWNGELAGCINDARDMKAIADSLGYSSTILTDSGATVAAVCRGINQASQELESGDTFLLTYSGHGGKMIDVTGDEPDAQDETWVLWDRQLIDDELNTLWEGFAPGVRIFMLSDSCHSGTVAKVLAYNARFKSREVAAQYDLMPNHAPRVRLANAAALKHNYESNKENYDIAQLTAHAHRNTIRASVLLISGCQDNQLSADGDANGLFTQRLLEVWNSGAFKGNYAQFHSSIVARMPSDQTPNLFRNGVINTAFEAEKPFTIGAATGSAAGRPSISAPTTHTNGPTPIGFQVSAPAGSYYGVEVALDASLFNSQVNGSQRTTNNFYASWQVKPFISASNSTFTLPADAWNRLRQRGSRLYYRVWCTDSSTAWVNSQASIYDNESANAPSVTLQTVNQTVETGTPWITAPTSLPNGSTPPRFQVNPGQNRYFAVEVATNPWYFNNQQYGNLRTENNFYASWKVSPFLFSPIYPAAFDLPRDAWDRLRANATYGKLYYRMWCTDSPENWVNQVCTTPDTTGQNAPGFSLSRDAEAPTAPE